MMTSTAPPPSPLGKGKPDFTMPMPPPLLHTRSGNEIFEAPHTPTSTGFTSPYATPQGSPSKNKLPPGATELPDVFDNAMKLDSPTKLGRQQLSPSSPNKIGRQAFDESLDASVNRPEYGLAPGSPTRKRGKENTPPGLRSSKPGTPNQAAVSRQEPYHARDTESGAKARYNPQRGLTAEELEKLQLPKVKRLANVTQLCRLLHPFLCTETDHCQIFLITTSTSLATFITAKAAQTFSIPSFRPLQPRLMKNMKQQGTSISVGSEPIFGNVGRGYATETSRFSPKSDKAVMDKSIWRRRRIQEKSVR